MITKKILKLNSFYICFSFSVFFIFTNFSFSQSVLYQCLDASGLVVDEVVNPVECPAGSIGNDVVDGGDLNVTDFSALGDDSELPPTLRDLGVDTDTGVSTLTEIPTTDNSIDVGDSKYEFLYGGVNLEKLVNGPYNSLDPKDYPYCVYLNQDLSLKLTDKETNNEVTALQNYLTDRGFLESNATGYFGRWTEVAVLRFQNKNELTLSGVADEPTRNLLKESTCAKYPKVTYVDKPLSPAPIIIKKPVAPKINVSTSPKKSTTIPTTIIPNKIVEPIDEYVEISTGTNTSSQNISALPKAKVLNLITPNFGNMYLSKKNNLYFTFLSSTASPYICLSIDSSCSTSSEFNLVKEGLNGNFEAVKIGGTKWVFTIYNTIDWGNPVSKVQVYVKDSPDTDDVSIFNFSVLN